MTLGDDGSRVAWGGRKDGGSGYTADRPETTEVGLGNTGVGASWPDFVECSNASSAPAIVIAYTSA